MVSFLIYASLYSAFSTVETLLTPLVTDRALRHTTTLVNEPPYAYTVIGVIGLFALVVFLFFRFIVASRPEFSKWGDRTYVFFSLMMGVIGSFLLIDYQTREIGTTRFVIGFGILISCFFLGRITTNNMFSKMVGNSVKRSYIFYCLILIAASRIIFCYFSVLLLEAGGLVAVFGFNGVLFMLTVLLMLCSKNDLKPHYSYLIEK